MRPQKPLLVCLNISMERSELDLIHHRPYTVQRPNSRPLTQITIKACKLCAQAIFNLLTGRSPPDRNFYYFAQRGSKEFICQKSRGSVVFRETESNLKIVQLFLLHCTTVNTSVNISYSVVSVRLSFCVVGLCLHVYNRRLYIRQSPN